MLFFLPFFSQVTNTLSDSSTNVLMSGFTLRLRLLFLLTFLVTIFVLLLQYSPRSDVITVLGGPGSL
jgi:hypothetical protein